MKNEPGISILIVLMGSMGDIARGLSVPARIKKYSPSASITWLVDKKWSDLPRLDPWVDELIIFDRTKKFHSLLRVCRELRKKHFDVSLDLQRIFKSGLYSRISGARRRVGFHPKNSKEFNFIFNNEFCEWKEKDFPKILYLQQFPEKIFENVADFPSKDSKLEFGLMNVDLRKEKPPPSKSITGKYVCFILGSSRSIKNWTQAGYHELANLVLEQSDLSIVLLGDSENKTLAQEIYSANNSTRVLNLVGDTNLVELISCIKYSEAVIGPDSGSSHIAAAVNVPCVTLFGPTSPERVAPYENLHLVVQGDLDCRPCKRRKCSRGDSLCMKSIRSEDVWMKLKTACKLD